VQCREREAEMSNFLHFLPPVRDNLISGEIIPNNINAFSKPLTFVNEKNQKKEALAVFKMVQIYMSDRKAKVGETCLSIKLHFSSILGRNDD
jgi:hypothetical protein